MMRIRNKERQAEEKLCYCGLPLHYSDPLVRETIERFVADLGENIKVTVGDRSWLVPRHYIALHGLSSDEVHTLGFEEVKNE